MRFLAICALLFTSLFAADGGTTLTFKDFSVTLPMLRYEPSKGTADKYFSGDANKMVFSALSFGDEVSVDMSVLDFNKSNKNRVGAVVEKLKAQYATLSVNKSNVSDLKLTTCSFMKPDSSVMTWLFFEYGKALLSVIVEDYTTEKTTADFIANHVAKGDILVAENEVMVTFNRMKTLLPKDNARMYLNTFNGMGFAGIFKLDSLKNVYSVDSQNGQNHLFVSEMECTNTTFVPIEEGLFKSILKRQYDITDNDLKSYKYVAAEGNLEKIELTADKMGVEQYLLCRFLPGSFSYVFISGETSFIADIRRKLDIK